MFTAWRGLLADITNLICNSRPHGDKSLRHAKKVAGLLTCPTQPQSLFSPAIHIPSFPSVSPFSSLPLGPYTFHHVWSSLLLCTHYTWWENTGLFYDRYIETRPKTPVHSIYVRHLQQKNLSPSPFPAAPGKVSLLFIFLSHTGWTTLYFCVQGFTLRLSSDSDSPGMRRKKNQKILLA